MASLDAAHLSQCKSKRLRLALLGAMSSKRFSPASSVLRSSRFFSLPPPLPRPDSAISGIAASQKVSDSATLPYPTQQAIATPSSSQSRGDWGLKRPLPLRSTTKTSTAFFRIHAIDTREHITDFDSAADLTISLEKYQELGVPVTTLRNRDSHIETATCSVFEPQLDHTDPHVPRFDPQTGESVKRWKFRGPWLAGLTEAEFLEYFERELVGRKDEFREFVRRNAKEKLARDYRRKQAALQGRGQTETKASAQPSTADQDLPQVTDERLNPMISRLRSAFHPASDLAQLLTDFLDLPSNTTMQAHYADRAHRVAQGPPSTHPSAGLSYLRTDALLPNHPVFGPQANPTPQKARVLSSEMRGFLRRNEQMGLAGFVIDKIDSNGVESKDRHAAWESPPQSEIPGDQQVYKDQKLNTIGLTAQGGNKLWVEPKRASVDERGRVHLEVRTAKAPNVDGRTGVRGSTGVLGGNAGSGAAAYLSAEIPYKKRPKFGGVAARLDLDFATGTKQRRPSYGMGPTDPAGG